jgi:hypothetical protein
MEYGKSYRRKASVTIAGYTQWKKLQEMVMRHAKDDGVDLTPSGRPECWRAIDEYEEMARVFDVNLASGWRKRARWYRLLAECLTLLLTVRDQLHVLKMTAERCRVAKLYR